MKKIKIMQVTHDLGVGGLPRVVFDISSNLNKSKFEVSVCCIRDLGELAPDLVKRGIEVHLVPPLKTRKRGDYFSFLRLFDLLKGKNIDILHTHNTLPFMDGTVAGKMAGIPVLIHTDHAREYPDKKRYMLAERILSQFVDKVVAVSEETKQKLIHYEKIDPNKIDVIWNGINPEIFDSEIEAEVKKKELDISDRYPIIGLGVRLSKQKGISYLLQAMKTIVKVFPRTMLLIAGYGELENRLKKEAIELKIQGNIKFLGKRLDMPQILTILDVYVLPSVWEGMPLVILEAMAAKKPIVATAVDGTKDALIHEQSGLVVPPKDPEALANAIIRVIKNPELARYLSENALKRFNEHFTVQKMVDGYENLFMTCYHNKTK